MVEISAVEKSGLEPWFWKVQGWNVLGPAPSCRIFCFVFLNTASIQSLCSMYHININSLKLCFIFHFRWGVNFNSSGFVSSEITYHFGRYQIQDYHLLIFVCYYCWYLDLHIMPSPTTICWFWKICCRTFWTDVSTHATLGVFGLSCTCTPQGCQGCQKIRKFVLQINLLS